MPEEVHQYKEQLSGRSMLVKKAEVIPMEAIVRGYITGTLFFLIGRLEHGNHPPYQAQHGLNTRSQGLSTV